MDERMSRGEMIRRLDEMSVEVRQRMANGPLTQDEQHTLSATLERLLPIVAEELQDVEDAQAAVMLLRQQRGVVEQP